MKRIGLVLVCTLLVFSLSACKGNKGNVSSDSTSSKITEKDIFEYNGTESEYKITTSEAEQLFNNQSNTATSSETTSEQKEDEDKGEEDTSSQSDVNSETTPSSDASSVTSSENKFDKDGDGWTDDWK